MTYDAFIERKLPRIHKQGFKVKGKLNKNLFSWQSQIVAHALECGRYALFEACGCGKTIQGLEWSKQVVSETGGKVIIATPLAVAPQWVTEGEKFGIKVDHVRNPEKLNGGNIIVTNYEQLEKFDLSQFVGVVLDESSCLKDFSGKVSQWLVNVFANTPFRLCCSATPSPNKHEELGMHAEFLGYCSRVEMLSRYFVHDSANTSEWRLKQHGVKEFWRWVATWAACLTKPSDIGYSDDGFILPPLNIETVVVPVDISNNTGEDLFRIPCLSGTEMHREMRLTCERRVEQAKRIVAGIDGPCIIWCNTNYEADALKACIDEAVEVRGSDSIEDKEEKLNAFTFGKVRRIISKPSIAGHGLNWQHCANQVFVGLSYSFEDFHQTIRRSYRFGQTKPVTAYLIHADTEGAVKQTVMRKMREFDSMRTEMKEASAAILTGKRTAITAKLTIDQHLGNGGWVVYHGDAVRVSEQLESDSVGFSIYSPPFASLYTYSDDPQDMGNCAGDDEFLEQYRFLVKEKFRITKQGRLSAVHCADLPAQIWKDGYQGLKDFSGDIRQVHEDCGWIFHCRATIWKDPVVEMQRTKALGLLYKQLKKDSCRCRVGNPDYILVFRKPGENMEPVEHDPEEYPVEQWQKDASPVWMDIDQTDVLSRDGARDQKDERHICPLQLGVIRRCLRLWSNKGDLVYSPFCGIGSEGYCAVEAGRRFVGSELKESYVRQAVQYLKKAEAEKSSFFQFAK